MPQNFLECDREQVFLMPPDPRDWLPEDHFAWFVLASVDELDLAGFYVSYRLDVVVRHLLSHGASWRRIYLQGIDSSEIVHAVHERPAPMIPAANGLRRTR
jgi:hypothetical protein